MLFIFLFTDSPNINKDYNQVNRLKWISELSPFELQSLLCKFLKPSEQFVSLFKKKLFDLEVKDQGLTKVITVCDTPPYGHAPTYQI
jgi:hypothetical protein